VGPRTGLDTEAKEKNPLSLSLLFFIVNKEEHFRLIPLHTVPTLGIRITFIDQLPTSHVFL
jgi:hypothetical protein